MTRFQKQLQFILEVDKTKNIFRQTHLTHRGRNENDAEHAWHMAMMIYLLKEYANEEIDLAKTMMMALIHDIVEIDAGDTYAYDDQGLATQKEREAQAAKRIFGLLPADQKAEMMALFEEFEAYESAEAKFAHAIDNFQPLLLNDSNNGYDWESHDVSAKRILKRHSLSKLGSNKIGEYSEKLIDENVVKGNLKGE
ncbi:MAG: HD domain-containing protein [Longicatena sp.]|nr:HD domain-containing protein [Longicatena sp.]